MPTSALMNPEQIWQAALGELQLQLTGATFNAWLARAKLVSFEDGTVTIGVHNQYAQDWLEHRLDAKIRSTLASVCGQAVAIKFVVYQNSEPAQLAATVPEVDEERADFVPPSMPDLNEVGWFPVSRYESQFWRPLLGRVAWAVWEIVRATDIRSKEKKTDWTPVQRVTAPSLAEQVGCGKQAVTGVNRNGSGHQAGAFDRLRTLEIGQVERRGEEPHVIYLVSVRVRLPMLVPAHVFELPERLQLAHDRWLADHGFDPSDWFMT